MDQGGLDRTDNYSDDLNQFENENKLKSPEVSR